MYGSYRDVSRKSVEELKEMKALGVGFLYMGLESGSDKVLSDIHKGYTADEAIDAGQKLREAGIAYGTSVILGLGGAEDSEAHIRGTLRVLNETNHSAVGLMVLNPQSGTPLFEEIQAGNFILSTYKQIFYEEQEILKGFEPKQSTFIYTGGFLPTNEVIAGQFPADKNRILNQLENRKTQDRRWLKETIKLNGHL
ncbi:Radical SAM superfamily protein [Evansella caseinilytica]|uniref:Radical SAM superfamily protein n=1 Tax=Evansella caseinilytica TaxID=1503961 RepID=A0A1H3G672_9BACI|nr:radical SAM protein [Evansella caseinilytica]SDX98547.1 Radical SAM superfamily protein [Evansella caseinilytica]